MKLGSTLLTFGFSFDSFKRWLQNFGFIHTDSKIWSLVLGNGESSKSQYRRYLEAGKGCISIASVFTNKIAANIFSVINPEDSMFFNFFYWRNFQRVYSWSIQTSLIFCTESYQTQKETRKCILDKLKKKKKSKIRCHFCPLIAEQATVVLTFILTVKMDKNGHKQTTDI
jgi:hypothetical protein